MIRDISSSDIVAGNRTANLREVVEARLAAQGRPLAEIRSREIRGGAVDAREAELRELRYETSTGTEHFLSMTTPDDRLLAFLRLALPTDPAFIDEIANSALIREVHVYGALTPLGEHAINAPQHQGFGRHLITHSTHLARAAGYSDLAVISSIGTRPYYSRLGFKQGPLYQHLQL